MFHAFRILISKLNDIAFKKCYVPNLLHKRYRIDWLSIFSHFKVYITALNTVIFCRLTHIAQYRLGFHIISGINSHIFQLAVKQLISVPDINVYCCPRLGIFINGFYYSRRTADDLVSFSTGNDQCRIVFCTDPV